METTTKMGRPEKPPDERKTNILRVCLTEEERELLDKAANGKTSSWVRDVALKTAKRQTSR